VKRILSILLVIFVISLIDGSFVGCKGTTTAMTSTTAALKQVTVVIGTDSPLTGPASPWGLGVMHGVQLAVDDFNAAGGITIGDTQYTFKAISLDDQYDAATSTNNVRTLVNSDGARYIVDFDTDSSVALASELSSEKVINFTVCVDDRVLDNAASSYTFRTCNSYSEVIPSFTAWIAKTYPNVKTMAIVSVNNLNGSVATEDSVAAAKAVNITVNSTVSYDSGTVDFTPFVAKILSSNPDMLMITGCPAGDTALIFRTARDNGYKGLMATQPNQAAADMLTVAGEANLEGVVSDNLALLPPLISPTALGLAAREVAKWGTSYGDTWDFYGQTILMLTAMKRAQSIDTTAVKNILQDPTQKWPYVAFTEGTATFDSAVAKALYGANALNQISAPYAISVIHNGNDTVAAVVNP
jgi:branched-chain amino acid transport system substrate-binding protein